MRPVDRADHARILPQRDLAAHCPGAGLVGIFQFLWVWNDLLVALIFAGATSCATVKLADMVGTRGQDWNGSRRAEFVAIAVPLIVFLSLQRYFVRGRWRVV